MLRTTHRRRTAPSPGSSSRPRSPAPPEADAPSAPPAPRRPARDARLCAAPGPPPSSAAGPGPARTAGTGSAGAAPTPGAAAHSSCPESSRSSLRGRKSRGSGLMGECLTEATTGSRSHRILSDGLTQPAPELLEIPGQTASHQMMRSTLPSQNQTQMPVPARHVQGVNDNRRGENRGGRNNASRQRGLTSKDGRQRTKVRNGYSAPCGSGQSCPERLPSPDAQPDRCDLRAQALQPAGVEPQEAQSGGNRSPPSWCDGCSAKRCRRYGTSRTPARCTSNAAGRRVAFHAHAQKEKLPCEPETS
ncbi:exported hypothetical protein [Streptomyces misionensis JCM 4497]